TCRSRRHPARLGPTRTGEDTGPPALRTPHETAPAGPADASRDRTCRPVRAPPTPRADGTPRRTHGKPHRVPLRPPGAAGAPPPDRRHTAPGGTRHASAPPGPGTTPARRPCGRLTGPPLPSGPCLARAPSRRHTAPHPRQATPRPRHTARLSRHTTPGPPPHRARRPRERLAPARTGEDTGPPTLPDASRDRRRPCGRLTRPPCRPSRAPPAPRADGTPPLTHGRPHRGPVTPPGSAVTPPRTTATPPRTAATPPRTAVAIAPFRPALTDARR